MRKVTIEFQFDGDGYLELKSAVLVDSDITADEAAGVAESLAQDDRWWEFSDDLLDLFAGKRRVHYRS